MKANELRIGNLVHANNVGTHPSNSYLEPHTIADGKDIENAMWYFPIPLTEEWLLKFGFEKKKHGSHHCWRKEDLIIDHLFYYCEMMYDGELECVIAIRYVHSLQNLYFALTGEELTIKTK